MPENEGLALFAAAERAGEAFAERGAVFVEIGAWCGKSSLYLGAAAEATSAVLFSIDHHHGSEENQARLGAPRRRLVDPGDGRLDTLPTGAGPSPSRPRAQRGRRGRLTRRWWRPRGPLRSPSASSTAATARSRLGRLQRVDAHVAVGGWLAIHDVFPDPADGGRPPMSCAPTPSTRGSGRGRRLRQLARPAPTLRARRARRRGKSGAIRALEAQKCGPYAGVSLTNRFLERNA